MINGRVGRVVQVIARGIRIMTATGDRAVRPGYLFDKDRCRVNQTDCRLRAIPRTVLPIPPEERGYQPARPGYCSIATPDQPNRSSVVLGHDDPCLKQFENRERARRQCFPGIGESEK